MSAGGVWTSARKQRVLVRRRQNRRTSRRLRCRTASRQLNFAGTGKRSRLGQSEARVGMRRAVKPPAAKRIGLTGLGVGSNVDDSSSVSSVGSREHSGLQRIAVDIALSMSCDAADSDSDRWITPSPTGTDTVLTPSKLRTRSQHPLLTVVSSDDRMPLLKKESAAAPDETAVLHSLVNPAKLKPSEQASSDDTPPVLVKEEDEDLLGLGPDSSADSVWTSLVDKPPSTSSSWAQRRRRHCEQVDRRFGYDTREWRVPKLTIRRRRASGQSGGNSSGPVSSVSSSAGGGHIYEILRTCGGHGSVDSLPPSSSDDSSYSDQKSASATPSPDSISPSCFYSGAASSGHALKRLRLKFGKECVAIDVSDG